MAALLPHEVSLDGEALTATVDAALALGRLGGRMAMVGDAIGDAMRMRHVMRVVGGGESVARALLAHHADDAEMPLAADYARALAMPAGLEAHRLATTGGHRASLGATVASFLAAARLDNGLPSGMADALEALWESRPHGIVAAALATGAIAASGGASPDVAHAVALAGAVVLSAAGCSGGPWVAPTRLDAASRSAAVQVDRSGAWTEWVRTWCVQLSRECALADSAVAATQQRFAADRTAVLVQPRVGSTDDAVLGLMQERGRLMIRDASAALDLTTPTVGAAVARLEERNLAVELTGQLRDRAWVARATLDLVSGV